MLAAAALAICALPHTLPTKPLLGGTIERGTLQYSGRERTWIAYVPARLAEHPALVVALHGSMGTGEQVRKAYGYDFDELADRVATHRRFEHQQLFGADENCKVERSFGG